MTDRIIRLVRHGRAAAGWDTDPDPDLDDLGREQAADVATHLARVHDDRPAPSIVSSPYLRCQSTAQHYADLTGVSPVVEPAVAEIPSPEGIEIGERVAWLRHAMTGRWSDLDDRYRSYRDGVVSCVGSLADGTVVFSHFVAINSIIGACLDDDRLVIRSLDNCSVTTVRLSEQGWALVQGGHEADTLIR